LIEPIDKIILKDETNDKKIQIYTSEREKKMM